MLERMDIGKTNVLAFKATGKVTTDEMKEVSPQINRAIQDHGRIRLFLEVDDYKAMSAGAFFEDAQLTPKMRSIEKVAVVGESRTQKSLADLANLVGNISNTEVKYFTTDRKDEAIDWVTKGPTEPARQ
jgi:hypothetical protein